MNHHPLPVLAHLAVLCTLSMEKDEALWIMTAAAVGL